MQTQPAAKPTGNSISPKHTLQLERVLANPSLGVLLLSYSPRKFVLYHHRLSKTLLFDIVSLRKKCFTLGWRNWVTLTQKSSLDSPHKCTASHKGLWTQQCISMLTRWFLRKQDLGPHCSPGLISTPSDTALPCFDSIKTLLHLHFTSVPLLQIYNCFFFFCVVQRSMGPPVQCSWCMHWANKPDALPSWLG